MYLNARASLLIVAQPNQIGTAVGEFHRLTDVVNTDVFFLVRHRHFIEQFLRKAIPGVLHRNLCIRLAVLLHDTCPNEWTPRRQTRV